MPNYHIKTYGCFMNYSDTERIETYLTSLGFSKTRNQDEADLIIFNTCSIRQKAEDRVFGMMPEMKRLKKKNKNLRVIITGCMTRKSSTQNSTDQAKDRLLKLIKEVDIILRIEDLPSLATLLREAGISLPSVPEENLDHYFKINATYSPPAPSQVFIPISTGCDKFCTYCIVPYSRGREKSRPFSEILKEARASVDAGAKEIILLGQTVNSYGLSHHDKLQKTFDDIGIPQGKEPFAYLLESLDALSSQGLLRVRWTSAHPKDMSDQLIDAIASLKTQMPHLHLPVQSGDDRTLKRMNRPYTTAQYREIIEKLRKKIPDMAIATDIIVGFCDETDEEFENTYAFFKEMNFCHAYLAQYSPRKGTFASKNLKDNIPSQTKKYRWNRLNDLLREQSRQSHETFLNKTVSVLIDNHEKGDLLGRNEHFKTVRIRKSDFSNPSQELGKIYPAKIIATREWDLIGEI